MSRGSAMCTRGLTGALALTLIARYLLCPLPAVTAAQAADKVPTIGWLWVIPTEAERPAAQQRLGLLRKALAEVGYVEGRNIAIVDRTTVGANAGDEAAAELVRLKVDVMVVRTAFEAAAAQKATQMIPIIFVGVTDPVALRLVDSLARPGGNMTGVSYLGLELNAKRLELLKEALPRITRVAVLGDANHPLLMKMVADVTAAAEALKIQLQVVTIQNAGDLEGAFVAMNREHAEALVVLPGPRFGPMAPTLVELSLKRRLPAISELRAYVEAGGFMAYGPDQYELFQRTAYFVDRVLKGTKPADLPVEQSTKFDLLINLKTAKALGLTIPHSLLARADQVIE